MCDDYCVSRVPGTTGSTSTCGMSDASFGTEIDLNTRTTWHDGNTIQGESRFSGVCSKPASNCFDKIRTLRSSSLLYIVAKSNQEEAII
jgi:hypothetical protein